MTDQPDLHRLAELAGVGLRYWDIQGRLHETSPETLRALLAALDVLAEDETDIAAAVTTFEDAPWRALLAPVAICRETEPLTIPVNLPGEAFAASISWWITLEDGSVQSGELATQDLAVESERYLDGRRFQRRHFQASPLPIGYHMLHLKVGGEAAEARLIIAPSQCYLPKALLEGHRVWGIAAQLYAVRSNRNWGMGDFSDLRALADWAAELGADAVGLNPLHALFPGAPERVSPYSPNSRLFLDQRYLDVTASPDFTHSDEARRIVESGSFRRELAQARGGELIDYPRIAALKASVLEQLFIEFRRCGPDDARVIAFNRFRAAGGEDLRRFAVFQALSEHLDRQDWSQWPARFRDPASPEVAVFANDHQERVAFFEYLQWEADRQLAAAGDRGRSTGMAIGLYGDLSVSIDPDGADHWSAQHIFAGQARIGAPPDPFCEAGQDWGVVPMNPMRLREMAYAPFIALLRANMRHMGALRIDHVMGLQRLFWIPRGAPSAEGAYVAYPFEDLLAILALESHRNRCLVVGEDLGTVPEGFRSRMAENQVLSYRVLYFEKEHDRFRRPADYPALAAACVATHDLATLKGFWDGEDIAAKVRLGVIASDDEAARARAEREADKRGLLQALADEALLPAGVDWAAAQSAELRDDLARAIYAYLARSRASLFMIQLDDLVGERRQANLPGTIDEYPNWRRRVSQGLDELGHDHRVAAMAEIITHERDQRDAPS